ncbi:MAG: hypothetical protein AAF787_23495, partial [Chloroflexota bacterium]
IECNTDIVTICYAGVIRYSELKYAYETMMAVLETGPVYCVVDITEVMFTRASVETIEQTGDDFSFAEHPNLLGMFYVLPDALSHPRTESLYAYCERKGVLHRAYLCETINEALCTISNVDHNDPFSCTGSSIRLSDLQWA